MSKVIQTVSLKVLLKNRYHKTTGDWQSDETMIAGKASVISDITSLLPVGYIADFNNRMNLNFEVYLINKWKWIKKADQNVLKKYLSSQWLEGQGVQITRTDQCLLKVKVKGY